MAKVKSFSECAGHVTSGVQAMLPVGCRQH